MAATALRDDALSLLAAVNNHGDLAVKLSSLKQVKDILLSVEPHIAAELFPYLAELQSSRERLVRRYLVEMIEEIGLRAMEHSYALVVVLLSFLRDEDPAVTKQSIVSGTNFFCSVLEEMALQFIRYGKVERWLADLWMWMLKFKDTLRAIALEPGSVGVKILALKFLETFILFFTSDTLDAEKHSKEGSRQMFNISWLTGGHPILDPVILMSEANRTLGLFLDLLQSSSSLPGALMVTVVHCLAAIGRKRPVHYNFALSALLDFSPSRETGKGYHGASIHYSIRTALLGFLRSTCPVIVESRDKLVKTLRAMGAGDAADQAIRQVDKMIRNNERAREMLSTRDNQLSSQQHILGDQLRKRSLPQDDENIVNGHDAKRACHDGELTPVEQMIAMIGALLAEGDRGAESLEILVSKLHPDMLADIVITNMKHLPKNAPPLTLPLTLPQKQLTSMLSNSAQIVLPSMPTSSPFSSSNAVRSSSLDVSLAINFSMDSRRDPRRDPRRMDPRRTSAPIGPVPVLVPEEMGAISSGVDSSMPLNKSLPLPDAKTEASSPAHHAIDVKNDKKMLQVSLVQSVDLYDDKKDDLAAAGESVPQVKTSPDQPPSRLGLIDKDLTETKTSEGEVKLKSDALSSMDSDQLSPPAPNTVALEETYKELPTIPSFVELPEEEQKRVKKLAVGQIIESYKHLHGVDTSQMRMALLARLAAEINTDDDDIVMMLREHILVDYRQQKGHELVLHVLYHLHSLMTLGSDEYSSFAAVAYEKFLVSVARSLLEALPASDKSFSRLLGEVPSLPDSAMKLLNDLCYNDVHDPNGKELRDGERVTQGLGSVWSLILGRPNNRQACLEIALKCSVHPEEDIRAKSIRLVTNKLHQLSYISGHIEQFARDMLLSAVNHQAYETNELSRSGPVDERAEAEVRNQETSISGSQVLEFGTFESDPKKDLQPSAGNVSTMSFAEAQRLVSLYFALCKKKPRLLQLVFDVYGQAPKTVKQAFHRHTPILVRALGSSSSELLQIISDPPQGSENLLTLVLQILTQETIPSPDLIATVKHLYETKLKDVTVLIPLLSSLSKTEVLPIVPRLINLPLEKFQMALAHILQGSAHTGPALTPVEVLVAIHGIVPEKEGPPLKKITDACSACFEQRTVFTQQVLAKALSQMVDQTPLPLLFMRTVIQAIDAFPGLVDIVMEILSKLVSKQIWRLPKLWVGFLKCVSQMQPHSYPVLLKLPPPQLESTLNKYASLRGPLATYANQPSVKTSLSSAVLTVLGLTNPQDKQPQHVSPLHASDASSSVQGTTLT